MTPDKLWEKYCSIVGKREHTIIKSDFLAALAEYGEAVRAEALAALIEAVQQEHGGDITNPKCPICIAINAFNKEKNNG